MRLQKCHEESGELLLEHSSVWTNVVWWALFAESICLSQKILYECNGTERWSKFKGKLTCGLKNDISNLVNFHTISRKSKILHFNGFLLSKPYKVLNEKVQKSYQKSLMTRKSDAVWRKTDSWFQKWHKEFGEF